MAKAQGRGRRWKSLRQAVKCVSSKREVDDMASRLSMYRAHFQTRILSSLSVRFNQAPDDLNAQVASISSMQKALEALGVGFQTMSGKIENLSTNLAADAQRYDERGCQPFAAAARKTPFRSIPDSRNIRLFETLVLKRLAYPQMEMRRDKISEAHAKTFRWILDSSTDDPNARQDNFMEWLVGPDSFYWINGKAASGKSTLMKFLLERPEVEARLRQWSGSLPLIHVDFFFWSLGTPLQKTQIGLLRSLLHQLFEARRDLIPTLLPALWQQAADTNAVDHEWTFREHSLTLKEVMTRLIEDAKVVIFVDGLDEFDGDYREMAEFFKQYAALHDSNVKISASSRLLPEFEYSFEGSQQLQLKISRREIFASTSPTS